ncbi:MBL fold metallo-hydrolase [Alcanivorax sp. HI0033]|uniref:MBL fold metallo-hydrolase n=1 Tax=unclassified Alcanivorax TaxID=2638842 RepID=UPI0007B9B235|nr:MULTISPECIES: MBL fold metallo-hydrolase [unclassified Alcanivorax]KZX75198.1 MBL fold metallo-hydrolase [Alcanivorax sp. HI0013]KZX78499.1 MBL fold metallo-hydrolase [Alcanivorax sp. HI0011]KZY21001.1 MBL fold metallo-hydrolase [Alcanivorax sp. HI0035]KZX70824.1 MBL fold metallo-hydrolase [Alcanivorax sp. HI0003]KZX72953.1 MBL fold metallo-hydrolase [Alcanivorax sp. HI0007]
MTVPTYLDIGHHITRIDTAMVHEGLAACYLLQADQACAIIETGTHNTVPVILALLEARGIELSQVKYVIPTHVHLDHAGGVGGLMAALPEATLLVHPRGARHMIDPAKLKAGATAVYGEEQFAEIYGDIIPVDERRVRTMDDGDEASVGDRKLVFIDTPGHARHHFCVYDPASRGIFTGDTFGLSYPPLTTVNGPFICPTTTPVQFDPPALKASIRTLLALKPERIYLTHYGMVENPQPLGERLLTMVDDYVALAEAVVATSDGDAQEQALMTAMREYLFRCAREHGCEMSDEQLDAVLGLDIQLNSQGLAVWLQSRSR